MSEDETYQLIEHYLSNALNREEKTAFEKQLSLDSELAKQVKLHKLANELVIENRLQNVQQILLEEKHKGNSGNKFTKIIAGAIFFILGTSLFVTWKNETTISESPKEQIPSETITQSVVTEEKTIPTNNHPSERKRLIPSDQAKRQTIVSDQPLTQTLNATIVTEINSEEKNSELKEMPVPIPVSEKSNTGPCTNIQLDAKVSTMASCKDESNGSIVVREFTGGTAPYSVSIKNRQHENVTSFNLPSGNYTLFIQDKKGCNSTIQNILIPEKLCEKEYTFNPFMDELLSLPIQEQYGTLSIYERSGGLYFTKAFEPDETIQWNGYSGNGELNAGYFIFVLTLKDGQLIKGGITIVR